MATLAAIKEYLNTNFVRSHIDHTGGRIFDLYVFAVDALKQSGDGSLIPKKFRLYCNGLGDDAECNWDYTARPDPVRPEPVPAEKSFAELATEFLNAKMANNDIMFGTIAAVVPGANKATATIIAADKTPKQAVITRGNDGKFRLDYYSDVVDATPAPAPKPLLDA